MLVFSPVEKPALVLWLVYRSCWCVPPPLLGWVRLLRGQWHLLQCCFVQTSLFAFPFSIHPLNQNRRTDFSQPALRFGTRLIGVATRKVYARVCNGTPETRNAQATQRREKVGFGHTRRVGRTPARRGRGNEYESDFHPIHVHPDAYPRLASFELGLSRRRNFAKCAAPQNKRTRLSLFNASRAVPSPIPSFASPFRIMFSDISIGGLNNRRTTP